MSDEIKFTLHNPLTEEEWDMITDVDLDHTPEITFHTKHGKEVVFVKRKTGKWISNGGEDCYECSECHAVIEGDAVYWRNNYFCYHCGADMRGDSE